MAVGSRAIFAANAKRGGIGLTGASAETLELPETPGEQTYFDRLRNYIPIGVIGFFIFVNSMVTLPAGEGFSIDAWVAIACVVVGIVGTIVFIQFDYSKLLNIEPNADVMDFVNVTPAFLLKACEII